MYRCKICRYLSKEHERPLSIITKRRPKRYDNGGYGWEIAEEKSPICRECWVRFNFPKKFLE